jgi:hypothetical protein
LILKFIWNVHEINLHLRLNWDLKINWGLCDPVQDFKSLLIVTKYNIMSLHFFCITSFISKLGIFPLMCDVDKIWITELTLIHKNIRSVRNSHKQVYGSIWRKTHYEVTDENNNVIWSYRTWWDINDNVCLDLQNCCYSIYIAPFHRERLNINIESYLTVRWYIISMYIYKKLVNYQL